VQKLYEGISSMPRKSIGFAIFTFLLLPGNALHAADGYFDSNGVKIRYSVQGQGEPVVLIHGFTLNAFFQWDIPGITQALAKDYKVITFECRGHGRSGKPHDPRMYGREMAEDVVRLLDHLKIKKAHVVGYSMGGFLTLNLLATHPDRMLTATTGGAGWTKNVDTRFLDEVADSLADGKGMLPLIIRLTPRGYRKPEETDMTQTNQFTAAINDMKALSAAFRSLRELAFPEEILKTNQVPTLALIGSLDPFMDQVEEMKQSMQNLSVVVIKGGDHFNAFMKPEFTSRLKEFLAKNSERVLAQKTEEEQKTAQRSIEEPVISPYPGCVPVRRFRHLARRRN
jgi:pimeloyl-ACP methyl ester carboxylesterase